MKQLYNTSQLPVPLLPVSTIFGNDINWQGLGFVICIGEGSDRVGYS